MKPGEADTGRLFIATVKEPLTVWVKASGEPDLTDLQYHDLKGFGIVQDKGLDGVIILAYLIAIPANEIVVPTILMTYMGAEMMFEFEELDQLEQLLVGQEGWTLLTAVCLMLFSLLHNPCSTTILTIYKETRSGKWTALGALMPVAIGFLVCFLVANTVRLLS